MRIRTPRAKALRRTLVAASIVVLPVVAHAGSHTWDVNEVFSDATGNVQFVELLEKNHTDTELGVPGHTMTSDAKSFTISGPALSPPTADRHYLLGTAAFAALPGAPTPDAIIPAAVLPFLFSPGGDTVTYVPWDALTFGSAPTDGINSLNADLTTGVNSPTNYAGTTGSVDASASAPPAIPALFTWGSVVLGLLLATGGARFAIRHRAVS